jgi:hypothetical protein
VPLLGAFGMFHAFTPGTVSASLGKVRRGGAISGRRRGAALL